jgi:thiol-disulfide isomerase/thioredoxin
MRQFLGWFSGKITALCFCAALASAGPVGAANWQTDFHAAQVKAKAEKKLLLVDFTGSDWCAWCKKLKNEVFNKKSFVAEASKQFVLVELDFPHERKLPAKLQKQNDKLAKKYKVGNFPTVLILDPNGNVIASTGYRAGGPKNYCNQLTELVKAHQSRARLVTVKESPSAIAAPPPLPDQVARRN